MSFSDRDGFIWMDGEMVDWRKANVHVLTHTLHYGMGVFEGIRAYKTNKNKTAIFRLDDHICRLFDSAHIFRMSIGFTQGEIKQAIIDVLKKNNLEDGYIRPICFYGSEGMGLRATNLKVHTAIAAWPWGSYLGEDGINNGIRIKTSSFNRHHVNISMCRAKANGYYINSMLALQEALDTGFDEALILDVDGYVAEGSGENIFIVRDGVFYTPSSGSALTGITSNTVMQFIKNLGWECIEKKITRDEIYIADEVFFTGTAAEITPICNVDHRIIGNGKPGGMTLQIQELYFSCIRAKLEEYQSWLTIV